MRTLVTTLCLLSFFAVDARRTSAEDLPAPDFDRVSHADPAAHPHADEVCDGADNDFLSRVGADLQIPLDDAELSELLDPHRFVGRAPQQTREFLAEVVQPMFEGAGDLPEAKDLDV